MKRLFIKKHCALIALGIVLLFLLMYLALFSIGSTAVTFALQDQWGPRDALSGVKIEGALYDRHHTLSFSLNDGVLQTKQLFTNKSSSVMSTEETALLNSRFSYTLLEGRIPGSANTSTSMTDREVPELSAGNPPMIERTETILSDSVSFVCTLRDWSRNSFERAARFQTDILLSSDNKDFRFERRYYMGDPAIGTSNEAVFKNEFLEEIYAKQVTINGSHYVGLITNEMCSGQSGIYRIDAFGSVFDEYLEVNGGVTCLVSIPLHDGTVRVIGFEAFEDTLILVLLIDDELFIRAYDLNGQLLGEIKPETAPFPGSPVRYHAFINEDQMSLGIFYDDNYMDRAALLSLRTDPELRLTAINNSFAIGEGRHMMFLSIEAVDQKLVAVTSAYHEDTKPEERFISAPQYYLSVFEGEDTEKKLVYQGEFITDAADDYKIFSGTLPLYEADVRYTRREMTIKGITRLMQ